VQQSDLYSRLERIFQDIFDREVVLTPGLTSADVEGWDSFAQIDLTLAIESEFGVKFKTSELEKMQSVGDLASFIERENARYSSSSRKS
jgi:acyl carrier protein